MKRRPGPFTKPGVFSSTASTHLVFSRGTPLARIKPARRDTALDQALAKLARATADLDRATDAWLDHASDDDVAEAMEMRGRWGFDRGVVKAGALDE